MNGCIPQVGFKTGLRSVWNGAKYLAKDKKPLVIPAKKKKRALAKNKKQFRAKLNRHMRHGNSSKKQRATQDTGNETQSSTIPPFSMNELHKAIQYLKTAIV